MASEPNGTIDVPSPPEFDKEGKRILLDLIPGSLAAALDGDGGPGERSGLPTADEIPPGLRQSYGVFVSLTCDGNLRGCIGWATSERPLWELVSEMAVAAATRDPRFDPIVRRDLPGLTYEVSILGPLVTVPPARRDSVGAFFRVGVHGAQVRRESSCGLLLPQVADRFDWDGRQFLAETSRKAGLEDDAWLAPDTELALFRVQRFSRGPRVEDSSST